MAAAAHLDAERRELVVREVELRDGRRVQHERHVRQPVVRQRHVRAQVVRHEHPAAALCGRVGARARAGIGAAAAATVRLLVVQEQGPAVVAVRVEPGAGRRGHQMGCGGGERILRWCGSTERGAVGCPSMIRV